MRIASPISQLFNGTELNASEFMNSRSILVPDIRVDDYITDTSIARIGVSHYEGSEFTGEWKNGQPPIEWRRYSTSRHRSFGYTVFNEQTKFAPIKNLPQEYLARKMSTTVLRDHDKYLILAIILGRMTGKLIARTPFDAIGPVTTDAHRIANTGNQADYRWIAEPGELSDNEIQPSFATIQGVTLDPTDPLNTLTAMNIQYSDNWFDDNLGTSNRVFLITSALEAVLTDALIAAGTYTEGGWKMYQDAKISATVGSSYLGTLRNWNIVKIHPEFLPKVVVDTTTLVVDPNPDWSAPGNPGAGKALKQVAGLFAYKESAQVHDFFANKRQEDGGVRFDGTEYVQDMSYDAWVIDQKSEGIVPVFLPADLDGNGTTDIDYTRVDDSFNNVAALLAAARSQMGTSPSIYPLSGPDVNPAMPGWYESPYNSTPYIDDSLDVTDTGDRSISIPVADADYHEAIEDLEDRIEATEDYALSAATARANSTAVTLGQLRKFATPTSLWEVTTAGTTDSAQPDISDSEVGDEVTDGTAVFTRRI
jgi:hypothetical protein